MTIEHHDLHHEFPEFSQQIHDMKMHNAHFARLFDRYHEVDREVRRVEQEVEPTGDLELEDMKKERLKLKDELYQMLQQRAAGGCGGRCSCSGGR